MADAKKPVPRRRRALEDWALSADWAMGLRTMGMAVAAPWSRDDLTDPAGWSDRAWWGPPSPSYHGGPREVDDEGRLLTVPRDVDVAAAADRFAEHVRAAVAAKVAGYGPFGRVLPGGVRRGWLDRDEAVDLVLAAMDTSTRPNDRKAWLAVWLDDLAATDAEVLARADTLVPVLASGDAAVVDRLAPTLIAGVDDDRLPDVVTAALTAPTKKAQRTVLAALARRPAPGPDALTVLAPMVTGLDVGQDKTSAKAVQQVVDAWGLAAPPPEFVSVQGLWQPVPPVWQVPRFDHGDETPESLVHAWKELASRTPSNLAAVTGGRTTSISSVDIVVERYLAVANAVARHDPDRARAVLKDRFCVTWGDDPALVARPLTDTSLFSRYDCNQTALLDARARQVHERLGRVPCLLAEPSTVDLAVTLPDLVTRLQTYFDAEVPASEADLFLALTRLDTTTIDNAARAEIESLTVPVVTLMWDPDGWEWYQLGFAGAAVVAYLSGPVVEPAAWGCAKAPGSDPLVLPKSLQRFPNRLSGLPESHHAPLSALFPTWTGDLTTMAIRTHDVRGVAGGRGLFDMVGPVVRQLVRRTTPLPPGAAANLMIMQRSVHPRAAADVALAVREAWQRGLLRPGVPDASLLDWAPDGYQHRLAATVQVLAQLADEGMLAVVWPLLDDLLQGSSPPTGATQVVKTIAVLLPEVLHAVSVGTADPDVLALPNVRALAARRGTSRTVTIARQIVADLPAEPALGGQ
ncbi:MAG: hypothetical protein FWH11_11315 [Micrococcales bacterium]|nr:hypothetical protein [Micrococcales bacterium]